MLTVKSRFSENVVVQKRLLHIREEASSFEKIDYVYLILSYYLNIRFLSQYIFLGNCFGKSTFNSTNLFQGLLQGLQLKGLGSSLGFSVTGSSLGSWILGMLHEVSKYIF